MVINIIKNLISSDLTYIEIYQNHSVGMHFDGKFTCLI